MARHAPVNICAFQLVLNHALDRFGELVRLLKRTAARRAERHFDIGLVADKARAHLHALGDDVGQRGDLPH